MKKFNSEIVFGMMISACISVGVIIWILEVSMPTPTALPPPQIAITETTQDKDIAYIKHAVNVMIETRLECGMCHDPEVWR